METSTILHAKVQNSAPVQYDMVSCILIMGASDLHYSTETTALHFSSKYLSSARTGTEAQVVTFPKGLQTLDPSELVSL